MGLELEIRPDLTSDRDQFLFARWITKRLEVERTMIAVFGNPDLPVSMAEDLEWEMNLLDHFISLGIQRSTRWGLREVSIGASNMLKDLMEEEKSQGPVLAELEQSYG